MKKKNALWITTTAALIALLIGVQAATASLSQFVTGSLVNLILIIAVMTCGSSSGLTVALISPALAKLLGIGPLWMLIPFIMLGNIVLVLIWHTLGRRKYANTYVIRIITLAIAAICKAATLYLGIVRLAMPLFLSLPEKQAALISSMFSIPQLITASIGGALAIAVLPVVEKVIINPQNNARQDS